MGIIQTYPAYHATDRSRIANIIANNFSFRSSPEHWLGDGVYFFLDPDLAILWGKKTPTQKFGAIDEYRIIEAIIQTDSDHVCDMRNLRTYNLVVRKFEEFWNFLSSQNKKLVLPDSVSEDSPIAYRYIRCAFFNWLAKDGDYKCTIAPFSERSIANKGPADYPFPNFKIPYPEIQLCVYDPSIITDRHEYKQEDPYT